MTGSIRCSGSRTWAGRGQWPIPEGKGEREKGGKKEIKREEKRIGREGWRRRGLGEKDEEGEDWERWIKRGMCG